MRIRRLRASEWDAASRVIWNSFYDSAPFTPMNAMERFRDLVSPMSLAMNAADGSIRFFGTFDKGALVGVGAVKEHREILMLYVLPTAQCHGIGTKLLKAMELTVVGDIYLNASDYALAFYQKRGYVPRAPRRMEGDLPVTPCVKQRK